MSGDHAGPESLPRASVRFVTPRDSLSHARRATVFSTQSDALSLMVNRASPPDSPVPEGFAPEPHSLTASRPRHSESRG